MSPPRVPAPGCSASRWQPSNQHPPHQSRGKPTALRVSHTGGCATGSIYTGGVRGKIPHNFFSPALMLTMDTVEPQSLNISTAFNEEGNGAILHINCQSDGKMERWKGYKEEASSGQKQEWLVKLGALLKLHGRINCQWEPNSNVPQSLDIFSHPWSYRIADFPGNYKLFVRGRNAKEDILPRKDCYLCGMLFIYFFLPCGITDCIFSGGHRKFRSPEEFFPHMLWLLNKAQGIDGDCICQYCGDKTQTEINKIFPLPPRKEYPKGPKGPKRCKKTRRPQGPRGVTYQRVLIQNRNSIMTRPATTLEMDGQRNIGYGIIHPF